MTTYNGAKYLKEQLDSIVEQTLLPEEIIICDDCSSDETIEIIKNHRLFNIIRLNINETRIGVVQNFIKATSLCKSNNYIAFSDQDDVWFPMKLEKNYNALRILDKGNAPALVYSDSVFVNADGEILNNSFMNEMGIDKFKHVFETVIFGSIMLGCTIMINPKMREVLLNIPTNATFNHDAWVSLASFTVGVNYFIKEPLLLYRKHDNNSTISDYRKKSMLQRFNNNFLSLFSNNDYLVNEILLLSAFKKRFCKEMAGFQNNKINNLIFLKNFPFLIKKIYFEKSFFKYWDKRFSNR